MIPTGTVTFLFTDIEGSTKLAQQYPDAMPALLARHHEILKQSIQAHQGFVFEIVGDSFAAAFQSASETLRAALEAQRLLHQEAWSPAPIKVRMGIHTGTAQPIHNSLQTGYSGYATLALTQRIMSAGHGGQILLSGATHKLVQDTLPEDYHLLDLGERRLKDLLRPEHLYQLTGPGLPTTFPPLKTLDFFPNNLPIQLTTFVGREKEITEIKQALNEHRLITLTGSGGTGKTRVCLQVAADLIDHFDHGVWFVELAPLAHPELIPQTILSIIGIRDQPGKTSIETLKEYLRKKKLLLILDNCEHLIEASARVVNELLNTAPELKILASSREALGVQGELAYPIPSLSLPDLKPVPGTEELSKYEAVQLFIDRARLVLPHFDMDKNNAPFIAQICYRLDGIPLAIELAAARVKMMTVEQISARLDDRFRLLTGGARTALPRQQTLRALIDWSYNLLSETERLLLRRLSVFADSWTLEAAENVCAGEGIESHEILDLLTQLINKSLVIVEEGSQSREIRHRMLETVRQYAREKLWEAGSDADIRQKHLAYFLKLVKRAEPELRRSNQIFWLNTLDDEIDNLRLALEWSLATDVETGLLMLLGPIPFWFLRSTVREVADWLERLLGQYHKPSLLRARALALQSQCIVENVNFIEARLSAEQSLELARALNNRKVEALSLLNLGKVISIQGEMELGDTFVQESLDLYEALRDKAGQISAIEWLCFNHNDIDRSQNFAREGLRLSREIGHINSVAYFLSALAERTIWGGDLSSYVADWLEEAQMIYDQLGNKSGRADILNIFGELAYWQGDYERARRSFEEELALREQLGSSVGELWASLNLAYVLLRQSNLVQARPLFGKVIRRFQETGNMTGLINAVEGVASLSVQEGQVERTALLYAWADAMRQKIRHDRLLPDHTFVERDLAIVQSKLNDSAFASLVAEGGTMSVEKAVILALEE
jgi:predicted ATPase/class 3 adenylate cyclase